VTCQGVRAPLGAPFTFAIALLFESEISYAAFNLPRTLTENTDKVKRIIFSFIRAFHVSRS